GYDIIGDVHGCADKLKTLLKKLGYVHRDGAHRHADQRQAIFVGDLIDRGPLQLESVAIPRAMVEHGTAQMVVANHEFNAIAYATRNADDTDWCRRHSEKNVGQHQEFLDAVGFGSVTHRSILDWFMSLPLWLDLGGVRVVHACWHDDSIDVLRTHVGAHGGLTDDLVRAGTTKGTAAYDAIETVLKGPEVQMEGYTYADKDGNERTKGRVEWWNTEAETLRDIVRIDPSWTLTDPLGNPATDLPATPLADVVGLVSPYPDDAPPVLFGHYWFTESDARPSTPTTACVDFSAVKGGPLVAYRWDGEPTLESGNFVSV
ncbi:MAG: metallophosphoesterase, partial [Ilumatobacter sp.]